MTDFIVAIELGSSKVTGIAGKRNLDGSVTVMAAVREDSRAFIHRGVVYNIDKTAQCVTKIINRLSTQLKTEITRVYVGMGGQSIRSVKNSIVRTLPASTKVTMEMVDSLRDQNYSTPYTDRELLDVAEQEYGVDQQLQADPVGIECSALEGNFLNILIRAAFYRNLKSCFEGAGIDVVEFIISPIVLAEGVLTDTERRSGCALVDMGATTTTVSVYYKNKLRHLVVLPLGSENINTDLMAHNMDEQEAERMKLKYGSAWTESSEIDTTAKLNIDGERQMENRRFIEVVEGRMTEIIENVKYQIGSSGYGDRLLAGIVVTGGAANMKNVERAFAEQFGSNVKLRLAREMCFTVDSKSDIIKANDGTAYTALALLNRGRENCAGKEITGDIFDQQNVQTHRPMGPQTGNTGSTLGIGVVDQEKKRKVEEEARLAEEARERELAEKAAAEKAAAEKAAAEEERRRNSPWGKLKTSMKRVFDTMTEPE